MIERRVSPKVRLLGQLARFTPGLRWVAAGYAAKIACSAHFGSGRPLDEIFAHDLEGIPAPELSVGPGKSELRASVRGTERRAVFRPGLGGLLLHDDRPSPEDTAARPGARTDGGPWPLGDDPLEEWLLPRARRERLASVLDLAFSEPHASPRRTRAVAIVQHGRLLAERYAPGFRPDQPLLGWSMSKSVVNALCGRLVTLGRIELAEPLGAPEWAPGDPRASLSFDVCLRMSSGLRFWEQYWNPASHVVGMLFGKPSAAAYAAGFPLVARPDTLWSYSSGTSNLLARALQQRFERREGLALAARELFDRIGMRSARLEVDASGHFIGSSFCWATARDWARFGQLYLQRGAWAGEQLFPAGWFEYTATPTSGAPLGEYGAHFWLNAGRRGKRMHPTLPDDLVIARGFEEQTITIVPSRSLVVVRLGQTGNSAAWDYDGFLRGVLDALPS